MALNLSALRSKQKALEEKGSGNTVQASKLGEEFDFRVLPPVFPEQDGIYFLERKIWWIDSKPYTSPATFGHPDVIEEEIEEAEQLAAKDKTLRKLLDDTKKLKQNTEFWIPALILDTEFDTKGRPSEVVVRDDKPKILAMGSMLMKAVNKIAVGRQYQNGTDYGFTDRAEGYNILGSKTGTGLNTEYAAEGWREPWEMDEKYYTEKAIPNIIEITKKQIKSDEYLRSVIRNYLYGEAIIEDTTRNDEEQEEKPTRGASTGRSAGRATGGRASTRKPKEEEGGKGSDDEEQEETTTRRVGGGSRRSAAPAETGSRRTPAARNIVDDVKDGLDGLEDD